MNQPAVLQIGRKFHTAAGALLLCCFILGWFWPAIFYQGYLIAFIFWVSFALGSYALLMIQHLTGGEWGQVLTRFLEAAQLTLPACALSFLPILAGLSYLYPWVHPHDEAVQRLVSEKAAYLNVPFFIVRFVLYFLILSLIAFWFRRQSLRRDSGDFTAWLHMQNASGPALILFVLLMNFACVDWIMCLKPRWYSSMLVVEFITEQGITALAGGILMLRFLADKEPLRSRLNSDVVHDLGNLLLGFICFWTYVTFSEYLIIWTGNLPHEVSWFIDRSTLLWKIFAVLLVFLHFVIPLFLLIFTRISKNLNRLAGVAALVLVAHFVQVVWWVQPGFGGNIAGSILSLPLVFIFGVFGLSLYGRFLQSAPLLPNRLIEPETEAEVLA